LSPGFLLLNGKSEGPVQAWLEKAVADKVFPGCVLAHGKPSEGRVEYLWVGQRGRTRDRLPVHRDLVYDLASITKVVSTTFLMMISVQEGLIGLETGLKGLGWPVSSDRERLKVVDLLTHQSGLPAWRPYYLDQSLSEKDKLALTILNEPGQSKVGAETLYSDLNFILLGLVLEKIWGRDLGSLFAEKIADPLNLFSTGFRPSPQKLPVAPTEDGPRLGGPLDWPGVKVLGPVPLGRVHDDNAAFLGGIAGQAGLFGTAPEIWRVICDWAESLSGKRTGLVGQGVLEDFLEARPPLKGPSRAVGFDIGQNGPIEGARGHLGYTGGSLWWDPPNDRAFVLLCNRVHPTARGSKMEGFRKGLAELLWA
jgi:CubicO group peptidase (beta-lactamase class C family)